VEPGRPDNCWFYIHHTIGKEKSDTESHNRDGNARKRLVGRTLGAVSDLWDDRARCRTGTNGTRDTSSLPSSEQRSNATVGDGTAGDTTSAIARDLNPFCKPAVPVCLVGRPDTSGPGLSPVFQSQLSQNTWFPPVCQCQSTSHGLLMWGAGPPRHTPTLKSTRPLA
jgi:hypothetical protein